MPSFRSTYVVGAITVPLGIQVNNHTDKAGALRELQCSITLHTEADWANLRTLINYDIEVIPMPWGNTVEVLVKGGPGSGTLTIPGFGVAPFIYTAWLAEATRDWTNSISGISTGKAKFIFNTQ